MGRSHRVQRVSLLSAESTSLACPGPPYNLTLTHSALCTGPPPVSPHPIQMMLRGPAQKGVITIYDPAHPYFLPSENNAYKMLLETYII